MKVEIKQFSSLEKIADVTGLDRNEIKSGTVLCGEHFSYQIALRATERDPRAIVKVEIESELSDYIKIYAVKHSAVDYPHPPDADHNYILHSPGILPDLLVPLEEQNGYLNFVNDLALLWVEVSVGEEICAGEYDINILLKGVCVDQKINTLNSDFFECAYMKLNVSASVLPKGELIFTQWFHVDCIASAHNVLIYSEEHWALIAKYMKMAAELGINMITVPALLPALDTAPGTSRPNTQLVKIKKESSEYIFDFSNLRRYIRLALECGIKHFEMTPFFSQWGCRYSPNIYADFNGEEKLIFGWHIPADSIEYSDFLKIFVPKLLVVLKEEGIFGQTYFHLSDEPSASQIEHYEYASNLLRPLLSECKIIDALSNIEFYNRGLVEHPICTTDHIEPFISAGVKGLWAYYCCAQYKEVSNRFIAMPSYRNRIIGIQLYKYGIEGFLHWGFNFYYSQYSLYPIDPYVTTSSDGIFSSGDAFSVYPGKNGPLPSIRALVFREALEDIALCKLLEEKIGKPAVVELIDKEAGFEVTFKSYPKSEDFIFRLTEKIKNMLG